MRFRLEFTPVAARHLRGLSARERATVLDGIRNQLEFEPTIATRNRRRMRPNQLATWRLRIGNHRAFYEVVQEPEAVVVIVAVGVKVGNTVRIEGEDYSL